MRPTSIAAGRSIRATAATLRARVFQYLLKCKNGATLEELEDALKMPGNTVRPRRKELEAMGMVIDSGATRPTKSGKSAIVWIVPAAVRARAEAKLKGSYETV